MSNGQVVALIASVALTIALCFAAQTWWLTYILRGPVQVVDREADTQEIPPPLRRTPGSAPPPRP